MAGPTADNTQIFTSLDPAAVKVADDVVTYGGEAVKVQHIALVESVGPSAGLRTLRKYSALDTLLTAANLIHNSINSILNTISETRLPASRTQNAGALRTGSSEVVIPVTVTAGQTVSTAFDVGGLRNWGIMIPTTFDGTEIRYKTCDTLGGTYVGVFDVFNVRVMQTVGSNRFVDVYGEVMALRFLQIECLTVQATTDTVFQIIGKT